MGLVGASFEEDRSFWQAVGYLTAATFVVTLVILSVKARLGQVNE